MVALVLPVPRSPKGPVQHGPQGPVGVVGAHGGVDGRGRSPRMAGLVLDEGRVGTVLYEVAYIAVAQAVHRQLGRQAGAPAPLGEALVYAPGRDARPPFGEPQCRSPGRLAVQWAHLL